MGSTCSTIGCSRATATIVLLQCPHCCPSRGWEREAQRERFLSSGHTLNNGARVPIQVFTLLISCFLIYKVSIRNSFIGMHSVKIRQHSCCGTVGYDSDCRGSGCCGGSGRCGGSGLIPSRVQWVKDLAWLWLWCSLTLQLG